MQGSKERVALRNEPLLAYLAIQLKAGPTFLEGSRRARSEHHTEERKFMSITDLLRGRNQ
jgi:hypothetical protein